MAGSRFEFATAGQVIFGAGVAAETGEIARRLGLRCLIVTGRTPERAQGLVEGVLFPVAGEPTIDVVERGVETARRERCDVVAAIGGGSAIDAGKAIAAMITNPGPVLDYLEVVGAGKTIQHAPAPFLAVPTTAGTGAEATRNAVLSSPAHGVKASLRSPKMLPVAALVDPLLSRDLPASVRASTGMDALTQLIEPFVSPRANPMTDALCRAGMGLAGSALRRAHQDEAAREDMALAALWSGMALANAGLGAVHGFAAPIGGMFQAPHGAVCAALLAPVTEMNLARCGEAARERYGEVARILTGSPDTAGLVAHLRGLQSGLGIGRLGGFGVREEHVPEIARRAGVASSMRGNAAELSLEDLEAILRDAL